MVEAVRPHRSDGHGAAWRLLVARHDQIEAWLKKDGLAVVKVGELLCRQGVVVPERTLHRYADEVCDVGRGRRGTTVRVNGGEPGDELQVDFGKMGRVPDPDTGRQRDCQALIFTPVVSRYSFVRQRHVRGLPRHRRHVRRRRERRDVVGPRLPTSWTPSPDHLDGMAGSNACTADPSDVVYSCFVPGEG